jgi:hypothetical protein
VAALVSAAGASAQDASEESLPFSFGGGTQEHVLPASDCQFTSNVHLVLKNFQFYGSDASSGGIMSCPVVLPHGGRVTGIECVFYDAVANGDFLVQFIENRIDAVTGVPSSGNPIASFGTTGSSGYQVVSLTLPTPVTLRRGSGSQRSVYELLVNFPASLAVNAAFRECVVRWNRQVSPAPAAATFSDVPVGHPQRQFVEALVAAGITGGCGGGAYCPDASVTRGQMAVFLAVALGLHFPN